MVKHMIKNINRTKKGFTLIELLVVVLILAILMAVALPLYLSSQQNAERRTCRANLQTIANAVQAQKVNTRAADYSAMIGATINSTNEPDLQAVPICPDGGTYSVDSASSGAGYAVTCTIHGTFTPGVSSD